MDRLVTFLLSTSAITITSFIMWYRNKMKAEEKLIYEKIISSPNTSWKKMGKVKEIIYYPLKSGKGKSVERCNFERFGITVNEQSVLTMKDRMFTVYEEESGKFQTGRQYPKLLLVSIYAVGENRVKLEVADMPPLEFDLPKVIDKSIKPVDILLWFGEPASCLDCGSAAAAWLSKFLTGSDKGLRLGLCIPNNERDVLTGPSWKEYSKVFNTMRNEDVGLFSDLASYMLMSESSVADLNTRLNKAIRPLQLRPNVVVEGSEPYAEDQWEWIRIGDEVVIRNFKPCTRCSMVRIDPTSGTPDSEWEPLKTLRSYRKLKDPVKAKVEDFAPSFGIYCGLYRPGSVKISDDVYVYQPN